MRHGVSGRKLNKTTSHRLAMFRNMATSLLQHGRIYTTLPKAKEIRKFVESMITLGKRGDLHARRQAMSFVQEKAVVHKLFEEIAPNFANRPGGYTRIVKVGFRRGDAAPMCLIELVMDAPGAKPKKVVKEPEATAAPAAAPATPAVAETASPKAEEASAAPAQETEA